MRDDRKPNVIEACYNHLKLCKAMVLPDYLMRQRIPASIPCPKCRYEGTIHYRMQDGQIVARCDSGHCVRLWLIV